MSKFNIQFRLYTEDFNNWRAPVNANPSGPDVANFNSPASQPVGFKGNSFGGSSGDLAIQLPKKKSRRQRLIKILNHIKNKNTK